MPLVVNENTISLFAEKNLLQKIVRNTKKKFLVHKTNNTCFRIR